MVEPQRMLLTMYATCRLSAAPRPHDGLLDSALGVYSPTLRPADEQATMAAPRAWAVAMADLVFSPK